MGGCIHSRPQEPKELTEDEIKALSRKQRRRLSLEPKLVGDVTPNVKIRTLANEDPQAVKVNIITKGCAENFPHAATSRKGAVPFNKNKVNQDRAVIGYGLNNDKDIQVFGVMDGHGKFGHKVSEFVIDNLLEYLSAEPDLRTDPHKAILTGCAKMCTALAESKINCQFSGTTCVFTVLIDRTLYIANIGDSRTVLCRSDGENGIEAVALSEDHKPDNPEERARIEGKSGRVHTLPGPPGDCGPYRVWLPKADLPGLAMSRSIGDDCCHTVGVINVPTIVEHKIGENDLFMILASDGVWEFIDNKKAVNILHNKKDNLKAAVNSLVEEAVRLWKQEEQVIDDITAVMVDFTKFN